MNHAQDAYPEECCGFLLGFKAEERRIQSAVSVPNTNQLSRSSRYSIDPLDLVKVDEAAERVNLDLLGIYHSHPDASAIPSQIDREYAWPRYTYLIVALENKIVREVKAWQLADDRSMFQSENLNII